MPLPAIENDFDIEALDSQIFIYSKAYVIHTYCALKML